MDFPGEDFSELSLAAAHDIGELTKECNLLIDQVTSMQKVCETEEELRQKMDTFLEVRALGGWSVDHNVPSVVLCWCKS